MNGATYQCGNQTLKHPNRSSAERVAESQDEQNVECSEQYPSPEGQLWEEHAKCYGGPEELSKIRTDDGDFGKDVKWVMHKPTI
jgi:hypothetical protein